MRVHVPPMTVERLPIYLRSLSTAFAEGMTVVSSAQIADMAGTNAAQVRKDLSYLGEYGTRGRGYDTQVLIDHLTRWLGIGSPRKVAIVGFGRLGSALVGYGGFAERGIEIAAVLDADAAKVGTEIDGMQVERIDDAPEVFAREGIDMAILAVPANVAHTVAAAVVKAGVRAILNFAPVVLEVPRDVHIRQADVAAELQILSFYVGNETRTGD